jgi:hypothetical protein
MNFLNHLNNKTINILKVLFLNQKLNKKINKITQMIIDIRIFLRKVAINLEYRIKILSIFKMMVILVQKIKCKILLDK